MTFDQQLAFTNKSNQFMNHCGIRLTALEPGLCQAELEIRDYCRNTGMAVHGGLLYTMADCIVTAYGRAVYGGCVTLSGEFHYLQNVTQGTLLAQARPIRQGGSVLVMETEVRQGETVLCRGTFTCYRRRPAP